METADNLIGEIELRAAKGRRVIRGRFPYRKKAVLSDGGKRGRPKKEQFMPGAFSHSLDSVEQDIALLVGHSFDRPLASKKTGTLVFNDTSEVLTFDATVLPEIADTSYGSDILKMISAGLSVGLSPGFRIPPPSAVPSDQAEKIEEEDPRIGRALIRTIFAAILFELSIVTRPAYEEANVSSDDANVSFDDFGSPIEADKRNWEQTGSGLVVPAHPLHRWRL
ncbi:HK97 family phage prohead protease [Pseudorhodoplanes sinuspersici]|nr:HK97 family phage prohead protease [Pseudorhodoplanes sinuspersici]RKE73437.1 hypothetical protein DFP91_1324 [Pseudorhodoplanes sinuspersici]